jgi:hypothetical protein
MSEFVNTIDLLGDDAVIDSIIDRSITEFKDDKITEIGADAFNGCANLKEIDCPKVTKVNNSSFNKCTSLLNVNLPELTETGTSTFSQCSKLADIYMPKVKIIGDYCFQNCPGLKSLTFEGKPTSIASNAFSSCVNLKTINVPWAEGEVANAPWGATSATINYNYTG